MMRLPKPAETNVTHDRRHIGSVYTAEQMRRYAAKATAKEREACAKVADLVAREIDNTNGISTYIAATIRARGNSK